MKKYFFEILKKSFSSIEELAFAGCATDLAIENAVREAHDRDFSYTVLEQCCGASDEETHKNSLKNLEKIATVLWG